MNDKEILKEIFTKANISFEDYVVSEYETRLDIEMTSEFRMVFMYFNCHGKLKDISAEY